MYKYYFATPIPSAPSFCRHHAYGVFLLALTTYILAAHPLLSHFLLRLYGVLYRSLWSLVYSLHPIFQNNLMVGWLVGWLVGCGGGGGGVLVVW